MNKTQLNTVPSNNLLHRGVWLAILLVLTGMLAYFAYTWAERFFISYDVTDLPGFAILASATPAFDEQGALIVAPPPTPAAPAASGPVPQPWDGASRVTVLVMGLDYGDWASDREGPSRTDTMILFTVDPLSKTAGMLNIPRDLWVNIPGFGYGKINTAYYLGEANQMPGGGSALAVKTVEQFIGVPINYYAQIDFIAFEKFIDEIDGVEIDVPSEIKIDPIGKYNTKTLQPGLQRLYGPDALAYARARNSEGGDFDRAQRQQQVVLAMRKRVLKPSFFPVLLGKAPRLYEELASGIHTNMTFDEAIQFAWLAQQIDVANIRRGAIAPPNQVLFAKSPDGSQDILKPIPDQIRQERDKVFGVMDAYSPLISQSSLAELMQQEAPRLSVLNGTFVDGLATRTQEYLISQGAVNVSTGNASEQPANTKLIIYGAKLYTVRWLVELMNISPNAIYYRYDPASEVDVAIILGADWANNNSLP